MKELNTDIQFLSGVGPKRAALLKSELNIHTLSDLLQFYPYRYLDRSSITEIKNIIADNTQIQIRAKVISIKAYDRTKKLILELNEKSIKKPDNLKFNAISRLSIMVADNTATCSISFFKSLKFIYNKLEFNRTYIFFGKAGVFNGQINFIHPEIDNPDNNNFSGQLTGIYSSSEKIKNAGITAKMMNQYMQRALNLCLNEIQESLPEYILEKENLVPLAFAIKNIHFPPNIDALRKAEKRLKFEELFLLQLALLKHKFKNQNSRASFVLSKIGEHFNSCYNALPYSLTSAQKRVIKEIHKDIKSGKQMNRLLQGDVGSGKTLVALLSALIAVDSGYQTCIMAPTEVLAQQHFKSIGKYISNKTRLALLTGSSKTSERREILEALANGDIDIIVGTHALIEDSVIFKNLALAIIDEQHRFGVEQRAKLWRKSTNNQYPHILVMTATPIPRTLAMTVYGDLDVSIIDELPKGRKAIQTIMINDSKRTAMYKFIRKEIAAGRQAFIVYPLIFENEKLDYKNLELGYEEVIKAFPLPNYKVAIVHGQQKNEEKDFNMSAFAAGRAHILVSTTVIEVGVDVPNASVMVIENAERFGLSQLHQLRGRVGRGSENAYCILIHGNKISNESKKRLQLMCDTQDGFLLAEEDMKMRGPGDIEGTQQSGLPVSLKIASIAKDTFMLNEARNLAMSILEEDSSLSLSKNKLLLLQTQKSKYIIKDYSDIS